MMRSLVRLLFVVAVAACAAAIADPLVESASNAGWFGPGMFTDHSTVDVVPVFFAGGLFVLLHLVLRIWQSVRGTKISIGSLLHGFAHERTASISRLLVAAYALQIGILFFMETAEQFAVYGHGLGGSIWLGAPVLVSLIAHAIVCVVVTAAMAMSLRVLAGAAVRVIRVVLESTRLRLAETQPIVLRRRDARFARFGTIVLGGLGDRAPPALLATLFEPFLLGVRSCFYHLGFVTAPSPSPA